MSFTNHADWRVLVKSITCSILETTFSKGERGRQQQGARGERERESVSDRERGRRMRERRGGGSQLSLPKCAFIPDPKQFEDDVIKVV